MKRYTETDFKTPFAQLMSEYLISQIEWPFFGRLHNTNIESVALRAKFDNATRNDTKIGLLEDEKTYKISNGDNITGKTINKYVRMKDHHSILRCFEIFEDTFANTTSVQQLIKHLEKQEDPPPGDMNFTIALQFFPAEATHMFVQMHCLEKLQNPFIYNNVLSEVASNLESEDIPRGMLVPPIGFAMLREYIDLNWPHLIEVVEKQVIPETEHILASYGEKGPIFN